MDIHSVLFTKNRVVFLTEAMAYGMVDHVKNQVI